MGEPHPVGVVERVRPAQVAFRRVGVDEVKRSHVNLGLGTCPVGMSVRVRTW